MCFLFLLNPHFIKDLLYLPKKKSNKYKKSSFQAEHLVTRARNKSNNLLRSQRLKLLATGSLNVLLTGQGEAQGSVFLDIHGPLLPNLLTSVHQFQLSFV